MTILRYSLLVCLFAMSCYGQGYSLVQVVDSHATPGTTSKLVVEIGSKMPPDAVVTDTHKWSVRTFDLHAGASADVGVITATVVSGKLVTLDLARTVDFGAEKIVVTFLQANFPTVTSADPKRTGAAAKFAPAKGSSDADLYLSGSITAAEKATPVYVLEAKAGYLFGLGPSSRYGELGPSSEFALDTSVANDPNHIKAAASYEKFFPMSTTAGWILRSDFLGAEFDRKNTRQNLTTGLNMKLVLPSAHLDTRTFATMDFLFGFEGGKNYKAPMNETIGSYDRILLGGTGYYLLLHPGPLDRITVSGEYRVRLPSAHEPFIPAGLTIPIFTSKARHHVAIDLNMMFSKAFGITAQYRWGSLPPVFQLVDHRVVVGLTLQLKQAN